ncbi:short-chain fatty acid transporter [Cesiribacter sp. SM1]|uniref:short-chain fatty acid transporter n=1 Tax=Cesiribacter sp. SM1 TaxID=2861196 RepID=UPI001CD5A961|nr:TIGR00366 family protein [Cesiribacter sp. SM1]
MKSSTFGEYLRKALPTPFTIALLLTLAAFVLPLVFIPEQPSVMEVLGYWYQGFWELLGFSMQMVLILVLGHTLALTPLAEKFTDKLTGKFATSPARAAALTGFAAMLAGFINWGLCLVFGAILARKVAERAKLNHTPINYPLVAAAGYSGMMIWHGGLSGSAPLVVAGEGHFLESLIGIVPVSQTLFSSLNLWVTLSLLVVVPGGLYLIGKRAPATPALLPQLKAAENTTPHPAPPRGAERLDRSPFFGLIAGLVIVGYSIYLAFTSEGGLSFLDLNYINFLLFGLCLLLHGSINRFLVAVQEAIGGASGIIIQFPFYAGIMGIMKYSGLIVVFANAFINNASPALLPFLTFLSAGLINIFVPSGGGQWAVQGPVVSQAAIGLGVPVELVIMALAYGDGITNMLQPFWALPLLGITGLEARDILPYTLLILLMGLLVYGFFLLLWT